MNEAEINELIDKAVAGRLSVDEEIQWAALLAERPELEEYLAVGQGLRGLPEPPAVSTNFTARVLQQIEMDARAEQRARPVGWFRWPRLARVAATAAFVFAVALGSLKMRTQTELAEAALKFERSVNALAMENREPEAVVAVFKNFEAIRQLPDSAAGVDSVLLGALSSE